jgi:uncharacterized protein YndB with AHSA1/START domain
MKTNGAVKATTPTDREIVLTHVFDAPRNRVYAALTTPDLLRRWYVPGGWSLAECQVDLRVGGSFRMVWRSPDGAQMGIHGVYRENVPPERLVHTEVFERFGDWMAGELLTTTVLSERDGRTTVTTTMLYPTQKVRDAVLHSGMIRGVGEMYEALADMLASEDPLEDTCTAAARGGRT